MPHISRLIGRFMKTFANGAVLALWDRLWKRMAHWAENTMANQAQAIPMWT